MQFIRDECGEGKSERTAKTWTNRRFDPTRAGINISYGIVFGIKPGSRWTKENEGESAAGLIKVRGRKTISAESVRGGVDREAGGADNGATEPVLYEDPGMADKGLQQAVRLFCCAVNKHESWMLSYHDAFKDPNCSFQGYHWHLLLDARTNPLRDSRWSADLRTMCRVNETTYWSGEVAQNYEALGKHIIKPPRVLLGVKGEKYNQMVLALPPAALETISNSPDWGGARLREDANYHRITNLTKLMHKYHTPDVGVLKQKIREASPTDWETYVKLMCIPSFDVVQKKSIELFKTEQMHMPCSKRFMEDRAETLDECKSFLSFKASMELLESWLKHNAIDKADFRTNIFNVLGRKIPKKNSFMIQGPPNSGKSYVLRSLVPYYVYWGEVHGTANYNFQWQGCLETSLIMMEEPMLTPETVEQAKLVLEGAPTMVNVKCKAPQLLQPTPVLITSNNDLWKFASGAREALEARMYHYKVKPYPALKDVHKGLNPEIWKALYLEYNMDYKMRAAEAKAKLKRDRKIELEEAENMLERDEIEAAELAEKAYAFLKKKTQDEAEVDKEVEALMWNDQFARREREQQEELLHQPPQTLETVSLEELESQIRDPMRDLTPKKNKLSLKKYKEIRTPSPPGGEVESDEEIIVPDTPPSAQRVKAVKRRRL
uniref:Nonstructural protein n=1 Tax=Turdus hortulorum parvoviridae sp. TaxID=2794538 RepID=A0A8A4XDI2_9VIRU|nr:MAG: nonstructural protein [Turdus hortulorum parvoviridae sp.]